MLIDFIGDCGGLDGFELPEIQLFFFHKFFISKLIKEENYLQLSLKYKILVVNLWPIYQLLLQVRQKSNKKNN